MEGNLVEAVRVSALALIDPNTAVNSVLYALSTVAQTGAALAALVGALALYKLQAMRAAHERTERIIQELVDAHLPFGRPAPVYEKMRIAREHVQRGGLPEAALEKCRTALAEWCQFDSRYKRAVRSLLIFEAWNLLAILVALSGFVCASWLAFHWMLFAILLIVCSIMTVAVTGGALYVMARQDALVNFDLS